MFGRYLLLFLLYITLSIHSNTVTMLDINALIKTVPQLLDPSISIKLVEVAKKYGPEVRLFWVPARCSLSSRTNLSPGCQSIPSQEALTHIIAQKVSSYLCYRSVC
jgi:hypothetical protein